MVRSHIREQARRSDGEDPHRREEDGEAWGSRRGKERQVPGRSAGARQDGGKAARRKGAHRCGPDERGQEHQRRPGTSWRRGDGGHENGGPGIGWQAARQHAGVGGQAHRAPRTDLWCRWQDGLGHRRAPESARRSGAAHGNGERQGCRRAAWSSGAKVGTKAGGGEDQRVRSLARQGRGHRRHAGSAWCGEGGQEAAGCPSGCHESRDWPVTGRPGGGPEPPERKAGRRPAGKGQGCTR